MLRFILFLLCVLPFSVKAETIAFIGSPLMIEDRGESCMDFLEQAKDSDLKEICLERAFRLRYSIEKPITPNMSTDAIEFVGFCHCRGMPYYTQLSPAFIVLTTKGEDLFLERIDEVEERDDGRWWACEEWSDDPGLECTSGKYVEEIAAEYDEGA